MKKIIALLLMLLLVLSACAKPDRPQQPEADAPQQQTENEQTPVDPKIDPLWKDQSITDEQRRWFFDLVKEYRIDAMYEFDQEHPMDLEYFKYYCAYFISEEDTTYENGGKVIHQGKDIEEIAKRFGVTYGLADDEPVIHKAGSLLDAPFAELIQYREENVEGRIRITARCINYGFDRYMYIDDVESRMTYPADRAMVLKGEVQGFQRYEIIDVVFYTENRTTPTQFVSAKDYSQWAIEDGSVSVPKF